MCDSLFHEIMAGNGESERPWPLPERQTDRQTRSAVSHAHAFPFSNGRRVRRVQEAVDAAGANRASEQILNQISPIASAKEG